MFFFPSPLDSPPSDSSGRVHRAAHRAAVPRHQVLPGAALARRRRAPRLGRGLYAAATGAAGHQHARGSVLHQPGLRLLPAGQQVGTLRTTLCIFPL